MSREKALKSALISLSSGLLALHGVLHRAFIAPAFSSHPSRTLLLTSLWTVVVLLQMSSLPSGMTGDHHQGEAAAKMVAGHLVSTATLLLALVLLEASTGGVLARIRI
jgi:hypothetical protein